MIKSIAVLCALIALGDNGLLAAEENAVYNELVNQGVKLSNGKTITLPKPVMADGLTTKKQSDVLKDVLTVKAKQKEFENGDPRDWFQIDQTSEAGKSLKDSIGRRIDLYFVAKGKLGTLTAAGFVDKQLKAQKPGAKSKIEFYSAAELERRKLTTKDSAQAKQRYAHAFIDSSDLLGKVQVTGSGYGIETLNPESVVIAFKMDPRFDKDANYPNQYQTTKTDPNGKIVLGPETLYSGLRGVRQNYKTTGTGRESICRISPRL
jgi:hypothetical protein